MTLTDSVPIEIPGNARSERAALKGAEKLRTKMLADADELKVARTRATVGHCWSDGWPSTRSSVRSIHAILSGACSAAVRWGWINFNPMPSVRPPAKPRPQLRPPTSEQMARIVEAAWTSSAEWGLYVWLSAVLGARRGEVVALQWEDVDLGAGVVRLDENYVRTNDGMVLKDTKSRQMRRVSVDAPTVELLRQHREDCAGQHVGVLGEAGSKPPT